MLKTAPQPDGWRAGPMLATGLTLRHYENFSVCPSLADLKNEVAEQNPLLDEYGIHVLLCQNADGEVILGDSHEYGRDISPFRKEVIDSLIPEELTRTTRLPTGKITERWEGYYAKLPDQVEFEHQPCEGVRIVVASGGAGMTMSFGFADQLWQHLDEVGAPTRLVDGVDSRAAR